MSNKYYNFKRRAWNRATWKSATKRKREKKVGEYTYIRCEKTAVAGLWDKYFLERRELLEDPEESKCVCVCIYIPGNLSHRERERRAGNLKSYACIIARTTRLQGWDGKVSRGWDRLLSSAFARYIRWNFYFFFLWYCTVQRVILYIVCEKIIKQKIDCLQLEREWDCNPKHKVD